MSPVTVIGLLTGGQSTRMGQDKATTAVGGITMAARAAAAAAQAGLETVVLGPDDAGTGLASLRDDGDAPPGPLGGLVTLLRARPDTYVILLATDQPLVRPQTLRRLADHDPASIVIPIDEDQPQVTCARYGPEVLDEYEARRGTEDEVWRLRALLDRVETVRVLPEMWRTWGEDGRSFRSIDRPEDIAEALADFGDLGGPSAAV